VSKEKGIVIRLPEISGKVSMIFTIIAGFGFLLADTAYAAGGGGGGEHGFDWEKLIWMVINFAALIVLLIFAGRRPVREYFKRRTEMIEKSIREAEEAKRLARISLEEVRERLKNTDREISEILDAAKKAGEREKEELITEGEELKEKILQQARANIEFELQKAKKAIKSEAALMALELAEKQIKERLGKEGHDALIDEYIKKLEGTTK
jgi:F-type H+-transporting ATPase subunit b